MSMTDEEIEQDLEGGRFADRIVLGLEVAVPEKVPILPMRTHGVLPTERTWSDIGRSRSLAVLDDARTHDRRLVGVFVQRDPRTEVPEPDDLHRVGCLAHIDKIVTSGDLVMGIVYTGIVRIELVRGVSAEPFLTAAIAPLATTGTAPAFDGFRARALELVHRLDGLGMPGDARDALVDLAPGTFCDVLAALLAGNLMADVDSEARQALLDAIDVTARVRVLGRVVDKALAMFERSRV